MNEKVRVIGLEKHFGDLIVLDGININIKEGEVVCVIGPSGSGKSTFSIKLHNLTGWERR